MKKTIYTLAILSSIFFTSCNGDLKDDIDDLQAENEALENQLNEAGLLDELSSNSETTISHTYSYNESTPLSDDDTLTTGNDNSFKEIDTDIYGFEIYKSNGIFGDTNYRFNFNYNTATKEVDLDYFRYFKENNIYGDEIYFYEYFYSYYYDTEENYDYTMTINTFNAATGEISFDFVLEYTEDHDYATYNNSGKITIKHNETLDVYESYPDAE